MTEQDMQILRGDCEQIADQLRTHFRDYRQFVRNYCRFGNALLDAVQFMQRRQYRDANEVCVQALSDVGQTGYANDDDTPEWAERFLQENDDE